LVVLWRAYYYGRKGVSREKVEISEVLMKVFREVNVVSKDHEVFSTKSMYGTHEYFYNYRKLWEDQKHRNTMTEDELKARI